MYSTKWISVIDWYFFLDVRRFPKIIFIHSFLCFSFIHSKNIYSVPTIFQASCVRLQKLIGRTPASALLGFIINWEGQIINIYTNNVTVVIRAGRDKYRSYKSTGESMALTSEDFLGAHTQYRLFPTPTTEEQRREQRAPASQGSPQHPAGTERGQM